MRLLSPEETTAATTTEDGLPKFNIPPGSSDEDKAKDKQDQMDADSVFAKLKSLKGEDL